MGKILIVEDHQDIQALLRDVLSPYYAVIQAYDGISALAQFHQEAPDLIILDLMLPNVTGESVLTLGFRCSCVKRCLHHRLKHKITYRLVKSR